MALIRNDIDPPAAATAPDPPAAATASPPRIRFGLSVKLLLLTVLFVMLAEVCIYVPSIANFRLTWLNNKLSAAHTAALVFEAAPEVPDNLSRQILDSIGARAVAMKKGQNGGCWRPPSCRAKCSRRSIFVT